MLPTGKYERAAASFQRALRLLPDELQVRLDELADPYTLLTLGVIAGVWFGAQFTPAGPLADVVVVLYGGFGLIKDLFRTAPDLRDWWVLSRDATTEADLDRAAQAAARALSVGTIDLLLALVGSWAFKQLRVRVRGNPQRFGSPKEGSFREGRAGESERPGSEQPAEERPAQERPAERPGAVGTDGVPDSIRRPGGLSPLAMGAGFAGVARNPQTSPWVWASAAAVGLVLIGGAAAIAVRTSPPARLVRR